MIEDESNRQILYAIFGIRCIRNRRNNNRDLIFGFVVCIPLKGNNSTHPLFYCVLLTVSVIYIPFVKNKFKLIPINLFGYRNITYSCIADFYCYSIIFLLQNRHSIC